MAGIESIDPVARCAAEVDSGYFGGYVKPANLADKRKDRRFAVNQSGKRKAVIISIAVVAAARLKSMTR